MYISKPYPGKNPKYTLAIDKYPCELVSLDTSKPQLAVVAQARRILYFVHMHLNQLKLDWFFYSFFSLYFFLQPSASDACTTHTALQKRIAKDKRFVRAWQSILLNLKINGHVKVIYQSVKSQVFFFL